MKNLTDIQFPIYQLRPHKEIQQSIVGPVLIYGAAGQIYALDDISLPGSFAARRLQLEEQCKEVEEVKFYKLRVCLKSLAELLHDIRRNRFRMYVDSTGYIFKYEPTTFYTLEYRKITKIVNTTGKSWHIEVSGVNTPLKLTYQPHLSLQYAGIIKLPTGYIVYELSSEKKPNTRRKI